jgi:uncharacterized protein involved in outer membrane biogenesis
MKRGRTIALGIVGTLGLMIVGAAIVLATFDWNRAKPWVAATVGHALGRSLAIDGDLQLHWQYDPQARTWRAWLPTPYVIASRVTIGNTPWAKAPAFATFERIEFDFILLPLLAHMVSIPTMRFVTPDVHLERLADGRKNWTFAADDDAASAWKFDLGRIQLDRGQLTLADRLKSLDVTAHVDTLKKSIPFDELVAQQEDLSRHEASARVGTSGARKFCEHAGKRSESLRRRGDSQAEYVFGWTVEGTFHGKAVKGAGGVGGMLALKNTDQPFPLHADVRIGDTRVAFVGTLIDPADLDALDVRLWLSGVSLAQLYEIFGLTLPESPPYVTEGHLVGRFTAHDKKLRYENFTARVGDSDLSGDFVYETRQPRPLLSGKIDSQSLQFRDLAPLIGATPGARKGADNVAKPADKVLPVEPFRPERWQAMDANVVFTGDHVFRDAELPIHKVDTRIVMENGVLSLKPLRFRFAYGDIDSSLRLDGRSAPIKATFDLSARDVQLKHVFPWAEPLQLKLGTANGTANLTASGDSVGALLGAADGEVKALLDSGSISKGLVETAGLNLPNILITKIFGDKQVQINCAAADLIATKGIYDARLLLIDTDIAQIVVTGNIDLANEKLDLTVRPNSKGVRLLSLRSPIYVKGTFKEPEAGINKGAVLARAAGATALALLATPVAALLPLTATNMGDSENACAPVLKQVQQAPAPAAAPPAKKKKSAS